MKALIRHIGNLATKTLKMYLLIPLTAILISVTLLESYAITRSITEIVRHRVVETQARSNDQVLYGIDQYFREVADIARQPGNSMEILPILRKHSSDVTATQLLSDQYTAQMFMFREIMIQNTDFESVLIYHKRQDKIYALSTTYLIQQDRQYDFSIPREDYRELLERTGEDNGKAYISGIRPSAMLIKPSSDYVVTYMQEILIPASIKRESLGMFFINIDVSAFAHLYDRYSADPDSDYYIVDREGRIVACSSTEKLAQPIDRYIGNDVLASVGRNSLVSDDMVYTISQISPICGWRVIKAVGSNTIFGYEKSVRKMIWIGTAILLVLELAAMSTLISRFTRPITSIQSKLKQITAGDMTVRFDDHERHAVAEIRDMNLMLQEMLDRINQLIHQIYEDEDEKRKLEMSVLQSQITPHFIYNTLSTIQWMASMQQADSVASKLGAFSGILSYCSRNTDYYVSLGDEITFIREYIQIMQLRVLEEVEVEYRIQPELMDCRVLRLLLQPIVENVFVHAFCDETSAPRLFIESEKAGKRLILRVVDNGRGIRPEVVCTLLESRPGQREDAMALNNIQRRIRSHYGNDYGISVHSVVDIGTTVTITLPLQRIGVEGSDRT